MQESSGETAKAAQTPDNMRSMATARINRLSRLRFGLSSLLSSKPHKAPNSNAPALYAIGLANAHAQSPFTPPADTAAAAALNTRRHTASSSATTCKSVSINLPFAPYWRMVIIVLAGAVAVAIAPSSTVSAHGRANRKRSTSATKIPAAKASNSVNTATPMPVFFRTSFLKSVRRQMR